MSKGRTTKASPTRRAKNVSPGLFKMLGHRSSLVVISHGPISTNGVSWRSCRTLWRAKLGPAVGGAWKAAASDGGRRGPRSWRGRDVYDSGVQKAAPPSLLAGQPHRAERRPVCRPCVPRPDVCHRMRASRLGRLHSRRHSRGLVCEPELLWPSADACEVYDRSMSRTSLRW